MINTQQKVYDQAVELTWRTYFEQRVNPPKGHHLVINTFRDILKKKKIDRGRRQHRNIKKHNTYHLLNARGP